ncbi:MAG: hypothetical protein OXH57_02480, partial [Ekhidna sp.]|nr:hypothetical protein [Ekhidna sp.]
VDEEKFITVLEGQMGHGKSNLLNAFYWCIFDQYWDGDKNQLITQPDPNTVYLFNKGSIADYSHEGKHIEMMVKIEFFDDLGNKYSAERNQTGFYSKGEWSYQRLSNFKLGKISHQDGTTKSFEGDQASTEIEKLFPPSLSNYFLFRGENRTELVKLQGKSSFQKALDELSKVAVFKRSVNHLSKVRDELRKELAEDADEEIKRQIKDALDRKSDAQEVLKSYESALGELEIQEQIKKEEYEEYQDKIAENHKALELKGKIDLEEKDRKFLGKQLDQLHEHRRKLLTRKWSSLLIKVLIKKTQTRYQKAVNSGTYPPDIKTSVVEKILHDLRCVCGREISPQSEEYKLIERLKKANFYDHLIGEIESIMGNVERVNNLLDSYRTQIKDQSKEEIKLQQEISEKNDLIEAYKKKIGGIDETLDELQNKQDAAQKEWNQTSIKIKETKDLTASKRKEIKDIEAELVSYEKKIKKNELPAIKSKLAEEALKEAENLKRRYEKSIYEDLEKYTQQHWDILVYDKLTYDQIKLDPDNMYFEVLDKDGNPTRSIMNTGHSILLVLSFISALTRIARETWKEEYPLVMDAPTSEIGDSAIQSALTGFGKVFNQAILILKDGSIPNKLSESLQNKIGKRYWIEFDKNKQHSIVESKELVYE